MRTYEERVDLSDNVKTCTVLLFDTQSLTTHQFQYPATITHSDYLQSLQVHQILFVFRATLQLLSSIDAQPIFAFRIIVPMPGPYFDMQPKIIVLLLVSDYC